MKLHLVCVAQIFALTATALAISACGGRGGGAVAPPTYTVGGSVSGLHGAGLVLQDNAGNDLAIANSGSFAFTTAIVTG